MRYYSTCSSKAKPLTPNCFISMANFAKHRMFLLTACNHSDKGKRCYTMYSFSDKNHIELDEPFLHEKIFIGSQYGWLTVLDQHCEATLFNPLTSEAISLPSITTLSTFLHPHYSINGNIDSYFSPVNNPVGPPLFDDYAFYDYFIIEEAFTKVLLSSNPSISSSNFFVAALIAGFNLVIARSGERKWNILREKQWYMDIMFRHNGKLICLTNTGAIHQVALIEDDFVITEISTPFVTENCQFNMYLAKDCVGRIHVILRRYRFINDILQTVNVEVFRHAGGEEDKWERAKSLDGEAIFVGANEPISLAKQDICGEIKTDTIYFTDEWWEQIGEETKSSPRDICAYDLTTNSIKPCCPDEHRKCTWPLPIWIHLSNTSNI